VDQSLAADPSTVFLQPGFAWASHLAEGWSLEIRSPSVVHVVIFDHANYNERLDDSRTKGNPGRMYVTCGDYLISKFNRDLMKIIVDDGPPWSHDLLTGIRICAPLDRPASGEEEGEIRAWSRLAGMLGVHGIAPYDIPTPLNLFKCVRVDGRTGKLTTLPRSAEVHQVELRTEVACLVGLAVSGPAGLAPTVIDVHSN
jgi:uncharacterized protein YcgI (DUF1989 family)